MHWALRMFFSPSGCTFWGKKPWSRKKKILWQLGTLVGAPVGIGLVAGIAIPAMIIGTFYEPYYERTISINENRCFDVIVFVFFFFFVLSLWVG